MLHRWTFLFQKIPDCAHILTMQLNTEIISNFEVVKDCFSSHGSVKTLLCCDSRYAFVIIWKERWRCSGYVAGQQETLLLSHLFEGDNGSGIISFHCELIWAVSVLVLRNMTCRGDEVHVPGFYSASLWETIKFTYKSAQTRREMYTQCMYRERRKKRARREGRL